MMSLKLECSWTEVTRITVLACLIAGFSPTLATAMDPVGAAWMLNSNLNPPAAASSEQPRLLSLENQAKVQEMALGTQITDIDRLRKKIARWTEWNKSLEKQNTMLEKQSGAIRCQQHVTEEDERALFDKLNSIQTPAQAAAQSDAPAPSTRAPASTLDTRRELSPSR